MYFALVEILCRADQDDKTVGWNQSHMREVVNVLGPKFESKGGKFIRLHCSECDGISADFLVLNTKVSVFLSAKVETITEGEAQKDKLLLWMEFVDRQIQPNYMAQRGVDMKKVPQHGISSEEFITMAVATTIQAASIALMVLELANK